MHAQTQAALQPSMAAYERWSAATAVKRDAAGKARAELGRREAETPDLMDWWRAFEADVEAVDRAIGRQRQAALEAGEPWLPQRVPQPDAATQASDGVPWPDAEAPATSTWHLSDGTAAQDGGWASGPQPDGMREFGYLTDAQPLGDVASVPAPDPKLYATYDGAMGRPSGPAMGTETGLAGKIKDKLT